jgi:aspartate-semialdehyde dehydrogenase
MRSRPKIAVVGATGAVGREMLVVLEQRGFPCGEVRLLASARSAGAQLPFRGGMLRAQELGEGAFEGVDITLFSAGGEVSRRFAPAAVGAGAVVVDNSSAFRMDPAVPLVIPEVNGGAVDELGGGPGIIANPNCSTIILLMALTPLHRAFGVERAVVSTYQAASGAGAAAMEELASQSRDVLEGREASPRIFPEPCAFNVFSHNSAVDPRTGRNVEEQKMIDEMRKIWADPCVRITATCIRVPVLRSHAESINVTLREPAAEEDVRAAIGAFPGVRVVDDRGSNDFPTSLKASGTDEVLVGRIRPDETQGGENGRWHGYDLFAAGDQLRKGAALNAVQIAELLVRK